MIGLGFGIGFIVGATLMYFSAREELRDQRKKLNARIASLRAAVDRLREVGR